MDEGFQKITDLISDVRDDVVGLSDLSDELKRLIGLLDGGYSAKLVDQLEVLHSGLEERVETLKQKSHILTTVVETNSTEIFDSVIRK